MTTEEIIGQHLITTVHLMQVKKESVFCLSCWTLNWTDSEESLIVMKRRILTPTFQMFSIWIPLYTLSILQMSLQCFQSQERIIPLLFKFFFFFFNIVSKLESD